MRKISDEVEEDVFKLVRADAIAGMITGGVYKNGTRPFNSNSEDIVVIFLTGLDGQKQRGIVNINAYVPDIDNGNELFVKNVSRIKTLGTALNNLKESLMSSKLNLERSGYRFLSDESMIQSFQEEGINQHYLNMRLKFEYLTI